MIRQILAIAGKPGLYKLVSRGNRNLIVETVDAQKKRMPAFGTDQVVSLGDISIYTNDDKEVSLASVFESIKTNYEGKEIPLSAKKASQEEIIAFFEKVKDKLEYLETAFEKVLPNYDTDRVRVSDMRKVLSWYNILISNGIDEFEPKKEEETETDSQSETETTEA